MRYYCLGDDMKKLLVLSFICMFLFTGCTNKVTCTMKTSDTGRKVDTTLNISFKNDKVHVVDEVSVLTFDEDYKDSIDAVFTSINDGYKQYKDEKGITIDTSKDDKSITVKIKIIPEKQKDSTDNIINVDLSKKELIKDLESEGYTCK